MSPRILDMVRIGSGNASIGGPRVYTTTFSGGTESPISEGGNWTMHGLTTGLDWADCRMNGGIAHGVHRNISTSDPTALLGGVWKANHEVEGTVTGVDAVPGCGQEVELRLRSLITANVNRGYEILWTLKSSGAAMQVVRWNGPIGDFTSIAEPTAPNAANGDRLRARMVGTLISVFVNDSLITTVNDSNWTNGNPGMGFWIGSSCIASPTGEDAYGFTAFTARDL